MEVVIGVLILVIALFAVVTLVRAVRIVPQQRMDVVERLGKYKRTLNPGLNLLIPFVDAVRTKVDMREQVVSFPPQPVITSDNLVVSIDTTRLSDVITGCGGKLTTCSRISTLVRTASTNGTNRFRPGFKVRLYLPRRSTTSIRCCGTMRTDRTKVITAKRAMTKMSTPITTSMAPL